MNTADIVKIVKKHKGPVFVGVCLRDDVVYMQAVKADLLYHLESIGDDQAHRPSDQARQALAGLQDRQLR